MKYCTDKVNNKILKEWKIFDMFVDESQSLNESWDEFISRGGAEDYDAFCITSSMNIFTGNDYSCLENYHRICLLCVNGPSYYTYGEPVISMTQLANHNYWPIKEEIGKMLYSLPKLENDKFYKLKEYAIIRSRQYRCYHNYAIVGVILKPLDPIYERIFIDVLGPKETFFRKSHFKNI